MTNMFRSISHKLIHCQNYRQLLSLPQSYCYLNRLSTQLADTSDAKEVAIDPDLPDKLYKRIEVEARCSDRKVLDSYETFVKTTGDCLGVTISRTWEPFRFIRRKTLLRAPFVKKKYRVQYEFRTYFRNIEFKHMTGSTADTLIEYIERNLPEGVALKVYRTAIEPIPEHIKETTAENL